MQVILVESEIHQAIQLYLSQLINVDKTQEINVDLEAKRDALGTRAYVTLTPNKVTQVAPKPDVTQPAPAPVQTTAPVAPSVAVGEPAPVAEPPAEVPAPAPVQSTPVPIADPSQVKPRVPRTPAEVEAMMAEEMAQLEAEEAAAEAPKAEPVETAPVEEPKAEETEVKEAEAQVPNAVDPVQVVEETKVSETETEVSQPVPQPVTDVTPIAEPSASTQVEDLAPKEAEVQLPTGDVVTEVTHSDPALPTGVPEPTVHSVPSDAMPLADVPANGSVTAPVDTPEGQTTDQVANPAQEQAGSQPVEGTPVRRSLFSRD